MEPLVNVQKQEFPRRLPPNKTIDRISTVALFALYPILQPGTKFGISSHIVTVQYSQKIMIPFYGECDYQSFERTIYRDSREEVSVFSSAIEDAISWYKKDPNFLKILALAKNGITSYASNYTNYTKRDNASDSLLFAANKIAVFKPDESKEDEEENLPSFQENIRKSWLPDDIEKISRDILFIIGKGENLSDVELKPVLLYLELKQKQITPLLVKEQASYH